MSTVEDDGLLSRWSKRKADAKRGTRRGGAAPVATEDAKAASVETLPPELEEAPAGNLPVAADQADAEADEAPAIAPEDLPDIDSLTEASDYTPFLQKGVPEHLARAALRKLWLSNSVFANLDGLNDYDENFRVIDRLITTADTNYQIGKGFLGDDDAEAEPVAVAKTDDSPDKSENTDETDEMVAAATGPGKTGETDSDLGDDDPNLG